MKRFVCFLLTFLMIVSLVPATVLTASAASSLKTSDRAIEMIKQFEGFSEKAYQDVGGTEWYIGYGTQISDPDEYVDGITKTEATTLLKNHVHDVVDTAINNFAKKYNIAFTQYQHDALASLTYNVGSSWMSSGDSLCQAVVNSKGGDALVNAFASWSGTKVTSDYFRGLMNRRLAEAYLYLNNIYSSTAPSAYSYVILDSDDGKGVGKVFAYIVSSSPALTLKPTKEGYLFLGWYLDGNPVTVLDKTTAQKTLTARWQSTSSDGVAAKYDINSSEAASKNVYATADLSTKATGTLKSNSKFSVTKEKMVGEVKWVYGTGTNTKGKSITGWVAYKNTKNEDLSTDTVLATGTVTATTLKVREAATTESAELSGSPLAKGAIVKILAYKNEYTASGTSSWGKIAFNGGYGWVNLAYVDLRNATEEDNTTLVGKTGKIVNAGKVNVRASAGVSATLVTTIAKDTKVTIYETQQVAGGATWGRIKWNNDLNQGWVYMYYVQVDGQSNGSISGGSVPDVAIYTGVVNSNTNLNIRSQAKVTSTQVGSLPRGTKINIYEKTTTNGVEWGRTDKGWVCLLYVNLTATGNTPSNGAEHVVEKTIGTVTASALTLRKEATNNSEALKTLYTGDAVTIVETKDEVTTTGTKKWGKVTVDKVEGWINLAYVDLENVKETIPDQPINPETGVYGVVVNCTKVNVRSAAGVSNTLVKMLPNGTMVTVYEQTVVNNKSWGRIKDGWVCMDYVNITGNGGSSSGNNSGSNGSGSNSGSGSTQVTITGTVNSNIDLNVRVAAGLGNTKIGSLKKGTVVTVTEQKVADGMTWGKISYGGSTGWVCMSYITVQSSSGSGTGVMGTVARCFSAVNVRSAAGVGNALVGRIPVGTRVEVFEKKLVNGEYWGRVAQGWVCMQYILLDKELPDTPATTAPTENPAESDSEKVNPNATVSYSFTGKTNTSLNVYKDAISTSDVAGTLDSGIAVNIVALKIGKDNSNEMWGKINDYGTPGWINLSGVTYKIEGFVQSSTLTVFASASADSEDIGTISINTKVSTSQVSVDGSAVFGKIQVTDPKNYEYVGWIDLSKIGSEKVEVTPELTSTNGTGFTCRIKGKTTARIPAYTSVDQTEVAFNLAANSEVFIEDFVADNGKLWGKVYATLEGSTTPVAAYVEIEKTVYVFDKKRTVTEGELDVYSVYGSEDTKVEGVSLKKDDSVTITALALDSFGNVWGQIQSSDDTNATWIKLVYTVWAP